MRMPSPVTGSTLITSHPGRRGSSDRTVPRGTGRSRRTSTPSSACITRALRESALRESALRETALVNRLSVKRHAGEHGDLVGRVPDRAPHLVVVRADAGLRSVIAPGVPRRWIGTPDLGRRTEIGIVDGDHHVVGDELRVRELLLGLDDRLDRVVVRDERRDEVVALPRGDRLRRRRWRRSCAPGSAAGPRAPRRERLDADDLVDRLLRGEPAHHAEVGPPSAHSKIIGWCTPGGSVLAIIP